MYLLLDIGGTKTRIGASKDGASLDEVEIIPTSEDFDRAILEIRSKSQAITSGEKIEAIAGGVAGILDPQKANLLRSPHLSSWILKPLKQSLQETLGGPVFLENDAVMNALGEATKGAGVGKGIVMFMTISTGVGGAKIVKGRVDPHTYSFEIGHQIINWDGPICPGCDGRGHLESYVSGTAIENIYKKKPESIEDPEIWEEISRYLAIGLHNSILHFSPEIVVLGGAVTKSIPLDKVNEKLKEITSIYPSLPRIVPAELGDESGLWGALHLLRGKAS